MSKRGENIRKRSDGRWEGRFSVKDPMTGKRKDKSVYAGTYAEAKEKLAEIKYRLDKEASESIVPREEDTVLLEDVAREWLIRTAVSKKHSTYILNSRKKL
ncbi:MAG: AP2 domain-containing protein [Lachnospiraceae bacterium]|nr:AP2 domain-containing protein [Lachnospiraceae bacterium]